jgi:hypothetical protein
MTVVSRPGESSHRPQRPQVRGRGVSQRRSPRTERRWRQKSRRPKPGTRAPWGGDGHCWGTQARRAGDQKGVRRRGAYFLESSLRREVNERAFLIQISRQKLFNSAELICSHSGECLKVRADLMHLVRCSHCLPFWVTRPFLSDARIFECRFLVTHCLPQAIPAKFDTHLCCLSALVSCLLYSFHSRRQNRIAYIHRGLVQTAHRTFKLSI